jgi:cob(I)alamin adenosyltransferase
MIINHRKKWQGGLIVMETGRENSSRKKVRRGLILVNTGDGKGKTTAALGLALRAAGSNLKVLILQFIKGPWKSGEVKIIEKLKPLIEIEQLGLGFISFKDGKIVDEEEQFKNAKESFEYACEKINSGKYNMVILDEINNLVSYGLLEVKDVINLLKNKPEELYVVLTGRDAPGEFIDIADTVTEMKEIKHAYNKGIIARKGIEY